MNKLQQLWDRHKIQRSTKTYSQGKIYNYIQGALDSPNILPLDGQYHVPDLATFKNILKDNVVDEIAYIQETFDCDDFSFYFKSIATLHYRVNSIGVCLSFKSKHAFNIVLTHNNGQLKLHKMEAQTDQLWSPNDPEDQQYITTGQTILI